MPKVLICLIFIFLNFPLWAEKNYTDPKVGEILEKMTEASGGEKVYANLKGIKTITSAEMTGMGMTMEITTISLENRAKLLTTMQGQTVSEQGYDGKVIWSKDMMTGVRELKGAEAMAIKQTTLENTLNATKFYDNIKTGKDADFKGKPVLVLICEKEGMEPAELYIGKEDYLLKGTKMVQESIQGKMTVNISFDKYKVSESGLNYVAESSMEMGPINMKLKVTSYEENPKVDDSIFAMPK